MVPVAGLEEAGVAVGVANAGGGTERAVTGDIGEALGGAVFVGEVWIGEIGFGAAFAATGMLFWTGFEISSKLDALSTSSAPSSS